MESSRDFKVYASGGNFWIRHPSPFIFSATLKALVKDLRQGSSSFLTLCDIRFVPLSPMHLFVRSGMKICDTALSMFQSMVSGDVAAIIPLITSLWLKIVHYKIMGAYFSILAPERFLPQGTF